MTAHCDLCQRPARETIDTLSGRNRCIRCLNAALADELRPGNQLRATIREFTFAPAYPTDLREALLSVCAVLEHGQRKHGDSWRTVGRRTHQAKAEGHRQRAGRCPETRQPHRAHAIARELLLLQLELEAVGS